MKRIDRKTAEVLFYKNIQLYHSCNNINFIKLNTLSYYYKKFTENSFIREGRSFREKHNLSKIKYYYKNKTPLRNGLDSLNKKTSN